MTTDDFDGLEPVERRATASIIADRLRERILNGSFRPGMQLGEAQLAERLAVSRGPVREAMQRLIQEGLLRGERHRGVFVIELDSQDVADIYLARKAIEGTAAALVARRHDEATFAQLEQIVDAMDQAAEGKRWADVVKYDLAFHEAVVGASGSKRLARMFGTLLAETGLCMIGLQSSYSVWHELVLEHRALLEAMRRGREPELLTLVEQHLDSAVPNLQKSKVDSSAV